MLDARCYNSCADVRFSVPRAKSSVCKNVNMFSCVIVTLDSVLVNCAISSFQNHVQSFAEIAELCFRDKSTLLEGVLYAIPNVAIIL